MSVYVWLASYPKSGNTWVRAFLTSVQADGAVVDLNRMLMQLQPASRVFLDELLGVATADLTRHEILRARPAALAAHAAGRTDTIFCKTHDAWTGDEAGTPQFPPALTLASIYVVRDPRDIALSFAHHMGVQVDQIIDLMADPTAVLSPPHASAGPNTAQPLQTWSQHVTSWLDRAAPAPLLIRYEDMLADPLMQGTRIARHAGLHRNVEVYENAVRHSAFDVLSTLEQDTGFSEARASQRRFFRSGTAGAWHTALSREQINRIEQAHGDVMVRLGYL